MKIKFIKISVSALAIIAFIAISPAKSSAQGYSQPMRLIQSLDSELDQGSRGDNVLVLQALLSANASFYPQGLITGFYGALTKAAVIKFQEASELPPVGRVGPLTLGVIVNELKDKPLAITTDANGKKEVCAIVPLGHFIAPGFLRMNDGIRPIVPECQNVPPGITMILAAGEPGGNDLPERNPNDHTAPVISSVSVSEITPSTARINWMTDERSTSQVAFGTTASYGSQIVLKSSFVTVHSEVIGGLYPNTTYHYIVKSIDISGNLAVSADYTFATAPATM